MDFLPNKRKPVVCWWSGGVTSAVACKIAFNIYGEDNCLPIMIDTMNEDDDTYRFKKDCEKWYGRDIQIISNVGDGKKYESIESIWDDHLSLNVARGAICSSEAKRQVRIDWQRQNKYSFQVFGFDVSEPHRAKNIKNNYPKSMPIFPLLMYGLSKEKCIKIIQSAGIEIPQMYKLGFKNNNCFKTGCVQGGIGYWQKIRDEHPEKFEAMAAKEHELTDLKKSPVTCLKDQSKSAKKKPKHLQRIFLKPHPDYPEIKDISQVNGRPVESLMECNGFCGTQTNFFEEI